MASLSRLAKRTKSVVKVVRSGVHTHIGPDVIEKDIIMASYTYVNGVMQVTTPIYENFERFHKCNAQHSHLMLIQNGLIRFDVWQFISYNRKIIQVIRDRDYNTYNVYVDVLAFNHSRTTSKQVTRWINEHNNIFPFGPNAIRSAIEHCMSVTPDVSVYYYDENITISVYDSYSKLCDVWR